MHVFLVVRFVNGNYEVMIEELLSVYQTFLQVEKITNKTNLRKCKFVIA